MEIIGTTIYQGIKSYEGCKEARKNEEVRAVGRGLKEVIKCSPKALTGAAAYVGLNAALNAAYSLPYLIGGVWQVGAKTYNAILGKNAEYPHMESAPIPLAFAPFAKVYDWAAQGINLIPGATPLPRPNMGWDNLATTYPQWLQDWWPEWDASATPPLLPDGNFRLFNKNEKFKDMKERSPEERAEFNTWTSEVMLKDVEHTRLRILMETTDGNPMAADGANAKFPILRSMLKPNALPVHPAVGAAAEAVRALPQGTPAAVRLLFGFIAAAREINPDNPAGAVIDVALQADINAAILNPRPVIEKVAVQTAALHARMTGNARAGVLAAQQVLGYPLANGAPLTNDIIAAVNNPARVIQRFTNARSLRKHFMVHLAIINTATYNNTLQRDLERQMIQYTEKQVLKMLDKDLWYTLKWGYLDYKSAHKDAADRVEARLKGLQQEVDPVWGRAQATPLGEMPKAWAED